MSQSLVVIGAGGFGRETLDVVHAINSRSSSFDVLGVLDDAPSELNLERLAARDIRYLGAIEEWLSAAADESEFAVAIGKPSVRRELATRFESSGHQPATLIHPSAVIGSQTQIGAGTIICSGVQVSTNVRLGRHVHLNPSVVIGHDSMLEDFVSANPNATVSGECTICCGTLLGAASVILQGLLVGAGATVGAAACVVDNVSEAATVKGVPGR